MKLKRWFIFPLFILLGLFFAYTWIALRWVYASGEQAGYIQKFSKKGWICKTWEGELSLVALPGTVPEKFFFSVKEEEVAKRINELMGKRVALTYDQHPGIPSTCFGETGYFVSTVRMVE